MKKWLKVVLIILGFIVALILLAPKIIQYVVQGTEQPQGETDLRFDEIATEFTHTSDFVKALPFMALATIDIDNDGIDEVFVGWVLGPDLVGSPG